MREFDTVLYAAFDRFPAPKGAAVHIAHTLRALEERCARVVLLCLGGGDLPAYQQEGGITIRRWPGPVPNFLQRTQGFGRFVARAIDRLAGPPQIIHFRDIWSGIPIFASPLAQKARLIFEVNGLPSVELPYRYPALMQSRLMMDRLRAMEDFCIQNAHGLLTVSQVNRRCLLERGADESRIAVLANTAPIPPNPPQSTMPTEPMILYAGTLSPWQGIATLLEAYALLTESQRPRLVLACSTRKHFRPVRKRIRRLGLENLIDIRMGLPRKKLFGLYRQALFTVAPLAACSRNLIQGCSPLKIVESMSVGRPVIASDIPVCAEIIENQRDGWLVPPDSPRALAHAMERLLSDPDRAGELGRAAQAKIQLQYNPQNWQARLLEAYACFAANP